jgi:ferritin
MAVMNEKMQDALNEQINAEMYSSLLYLAMSAYFESLDLPGFANWMRVQAKEEDFHVQKMFDYIVERGGRVVLGGIDKPPSEWESPLAVFEAAYAHEQKVSGLIHDLVGLASDLKDRATESFLRWFVDEQVEEEASVDKIVKMLRLGDGQPVAMLMADRELAARTLVLPPDAPA